MKLHLSGLQVGESCTVTDIHARGSIRRRLLDIGLIEGTRVKCVMKSPCGDPVAYQIRGAVIALRNEDGARIDII